MNMSRVLGFVFGGNRGLSSLNSIPFDPFSQVRRRGQCNRISKEINSKPNSDLPLSMTPGQLKWRLGRRAMNAKIWRNLRRPLAHGSYGENNSR